jgi:mono/diheme cytochrome c family protein
MPIVRRVAYLVLLSSCLGIAFSAQAAGGDAAKGKQIYEKFCIGCHGPKGKGDGVASKAVATPPADFTSAATKKKSDAELLKVIENGRPNTAMIAWKTQLPPADIQDVLAYVRSLGK